jgi:SAM-dependent methyltransferase
VVDLGAGSGITARVLIDAGYQVLGVELSPDMVELARQRAPEARFIGSSLLGAELPACVAVTAIGECLNYATDPRTGRQQLATLFGRIHQALRPGGLFLFDVAEPGRERRVPRRTWHEGRTGCCAWRRSGRRTSGCCGGASRCSDRPPAAGGAATSCTPCACIRAGSCWTTWSRPGFQTRVLAGYGHAVRFRRGHAGILAVKPSNGPS